MIKAKAKNAVNTLANSNLIQRDKRRVLKLPDMDTNNCLNDKTIDFESVSKSELIVETRADGIFQDGIKYDEDDRWDKHDDFKGRDENEELEKYSDSNDDDTSDESSQYLTLYTTAEGIDNKLMRLLEGDVWIRLRDLECPGGLFLDLIEREAAIRMSIDINKEHSSKCMCSLTQEEGKIVAAKVQFDRVVKYLSLGVHPLCTYVEQ